MPALELDKKLTLYLLGELSDAERAEIEDQYLSNADSFDELVIAEDELIDDYVREKLSRKNRDLFEQNFLCSPARQERVKSARALMRFADKNASESRVPSRSRFWSAFRIESPGMRLALSLGLIMILVGAPLLFLQINKLRSELAGLQSQQLAQNQKANELEKLLAVQKQQNDDLNQSINRERTERGQLEQEVARLREQQTSAVSFGLGFGDIEKPRGSAPEPKKITVPRHADLLKLQLDLLKDEYENYLVTLEDSQHRDIWRGSLQSTKTGNGKAVVVRFPSRLFSNGQYKLILSGSHNQTDYEVISEFLIDVLKN